MKNSQSSILSFRIRPLGLLTAAGTVLSAATLLGFLGRYSWFLDLFSHFRVQYMLGLLVLALLLLLGRHRWTAAVFLLLAGVNIIPVMPLYFGSSGSREETLPAMRAMLINVNTQLGDADRVKAAVLLANPDILVLEEISSRWMPSLASLTNSYPHSISRPREDNFGIGIFSKLPIAEAHAVYIGEAEVPTLLATVSTAQTTLCVVATHTLPPAGPIYSRYRNDQLNRLPDFIPSNQPVLLLGDLNTTPWNHHFRRLLARTGLRDSAKGYGVQPTWPTDNPLLRIPLDHCLHSANIAIAARKIGESVSSDHYPVVVDFAIEKD